VDAAYFAAGEEFGKDTKGAPVAGIVERGYKHRVISDIEICITGRKALAVEDNGCGHGQGNHFGARAVFEAGVPDPFPVLGEGTVIGVVGIGFLTENKSAGIYKAAEVVHVAVGIVTGDAFAEPEDVRDAKIAPEDLAVVAFVKAGITDLDLGIEQAFFGDKEGTAPVGIDGAAFEEDRTIFDLNGKRGETQVLDEKRGESGVKTPVGVFRPAVEAEERGGDFALRIGVSCQEEGADVAHPSTVKRQDQELDAAAVGAGALKYTADAFFLRGGLNNEPDRFAGKYMADDLGENPRDRLEFSRPVFFIVGPGQEGSGMGFPLGGHAESLVYGIGVVRGGSRHRCSAFIVPVIRRESVG